MNLKLAFVFAVGCTAALAAKPPACPRYPATVYVATSTAHLYGLNGDGAVTEWIDGVLYSKYVDGQGGVQAYVNGGNCGGTFFFALDGTRTLLVDFLNWRNNGTAGPPPSGFQQETTAGLLFLRGFSFTGNSTYTTMLVVNNLGIGGGVRYEPLTSNYLTDNPDFPLYPDFNTPCETSAAIMTALSPNVTSVAPAAVTCGSYTGPLATLAMQIKGGGRTLRNVGQYGMDFRFRIVVPGWNRN